MSVLRSIPYQRHIQLTYLDRTSASRVGVAIAFVNGVFFYCWLHVSVAKPMDVMTRIMRTVYHRGIVTDQHDLGCVVGYSPLKYVPTRRTSAFDRLAISLADIGALSSSANMWNRLRSIPRRRHACCEPS